MARGTTLAARWFHEPQPIRNQPMGWGFHTARGGIGPGDLCSCPRVVGVVEIWRDFSSGDKTLSFPGAAGRRRRPGCGGTPTSTKGVTLAARWLHEPQPISNQPVGLGFPHPARRYRPGGSPFSSPGCPNCTCMEGFLIRGWEPILLGVRWLYVRSPANQRSASEAGVSIPCGEVSTRGITVFVPRLSEL